MVLNLSFLADCCLAATSLCLHRDGVVETKSYNMLVGRRTKLIPYLLLCFQIMKYIVSIVKSLSVIIFYSIILKLAEARIVNIMIIMSTESVDLSSLA